MSCMIETTPVATSMLYAEQLSRIKSNFLPCSLKSRCTSRSHAFKRSFDHPRIFGFSQRTYESGCQLTVRCIGPHCRAIAILSNIKDVNFSVLVTLQHRSNVKRSISFFVPFTLIGVTVRWGWAPNILQVSFALKTSSGWGLNSSQTRGIPWIDKHPPLLRNVASFLSHSVVPSCGPIHSMR